MKTGRFFSNGDKTLFTNKGLWSWVIILGLVLYFQLRDEVIHWLIITKAAVCSYEECQDEICIEISLSQLWITKGAIGSFHYHRKLLSSLCLHRKLNTGKLDGGESRMKTLIPIIYSCHAEEESEINMELRLPSYTIYPTCIQHLTVPSLSILGRKSDSDNKIVLLTRPQCATPFHHHYSLFLSFLLHSWVSHSIFVHSCCCSVPQCWALSIFCNFKRNFHQ